MHEFGIARKLLDAVLREAREKKAKKVKEILIELGELADVTEEELRQALEIVSRETIAENAKISIEIVPVKIKCLKGHESILEKEKDYGSSLFISCPECGSKAMIVGGRECNVKKARAE